MWLALASMIGRMGAWSIISYFCFFSKTIVLARRAKVIIPMLQISTFSVYFLSYKISGAM